MKPLIKFKGYLMVAKEEQLQEKTKQQFFLQHQKEKLLKYIENDKKRLKLSDLQINDLYGDNDWDKLYDVINYYEFCDLVNRSMHIHFLKGNVYNFNLTITYPSKTVFYINDLESHKDFKKLCDLLISQLYYDFSYILGIQSLFFTIKEIRFDKIKGDDEDKLILEVDGYYAQTEWYEKSDKQRIETLDQLYLANLENSDLERRSKIYNIDIDVTEINYAEFKLKFKKEGLGWQVDKIYYFTYDLPFALYKYQITEFHFNERGMLDYTWLNYFNSYVYFDSINFSINSLKNNNMYESVLLGNHFDLYNSKLHIEEFKYRIRNTRIVLPLKEINNKLFIQMYNIYLKNNSLVMFNNSIYQVDENDKPIKYYCSLYRLYKNRKKIQKDIHEFYGKIYVENYILNFSFVDLLKNRKYLIKPFKNINENQFVTIYNIYLNNNLLAIKNNLVYKIDENNKLQYYCNLYTLYRKRKEIYNEVNKLLFKETKEIDLSFSFLSFFNNRKDLLRFNRRLYEAYKWKKKNNYNKQNTNEKNKINN